MHEHHATWNLHFKFAVLARAATKEETSLKKTHKNDDN